MSIFICKYSKLTRTVVAVAVSSALVSTTALADETLPLASDDIEEVIVVTGSRIEEKLEDVAGAVSVIDAEDIDMQVTNSLSDLFRYDPSITATGQQGQAQTLTVRGIGGNRVAYIKDGRRINDAYAGGGGYLVGRGYLDTSQISQIEVAKAAASPLYGSDGLGGVVVISTPDPDELLGGRDYALSLNAGFDTIASERKLGLQVARQFAESSAMLQVTGRSGNETQNYEETLPGFDYDSISMLAKWQFDITRGYEMKFTLDHFEQTNEQVLADPRRTVDDDRQTAFSIDLTQTNPLVFADQQHWQLYVTDYGQGSDQVVPQSGRNGSYVDYNDYGFEQVVVGGRWQAQKAISGNRVNQDLVFGVDLDYYETERPRFKTRVAADGTLLMDNEPQKAFPGSNTLLSGAFIQNNIQFNAVPFKLIVGARLDHYRMTPNLTDLYDQDLFTDINETALSPKLAGVYTFDNGVRTYLQYAQGFKIPPHDQAYQNHGVEPFYLILPNPQLKPESSRSYEVGFKFADNDTRWNVAIFQSNFDDFIETEVVGTSPTFIPNVQRVEFQYVNKENVTIKGAEAALTHWLSDTIRLDTSVAYVSGKNTETDSYLATISPLSGNVSLTYDAGAWYVRGVLNAVSAMDRVPEPTDRVDSFAETPGYGTLDLLAGTEFGNWKVNLAALNLSDKYYVPYQSVAGLPAQTPLGQYSQPGRSFAVQLRYHF